LNTIKIKQATFLTQNLIASMGCNSVPHYSIH